MSETDISVFTILAVVYFAYAAYAIVLWLFKYTLNVIEKHQQVRMNTQKIRRADIELHLVMNLCRMAQKEAEGTPEVDITPEMREVASKGLVSVELHETPDKH